MKRPARLAVGILALLYSHSGSAQAPVRLPADAPPVFRSTTDLVLVPVVVRDATGQAVGNLRREDFKLFDSGKLQTIARFSVEGSGSRTVVPEKRPERADSSPGETLSTVGPERFVAYLFDDLHMRQDDLPRVRSAALRHLDAMLPGDRAAIYSVSGRVTVEFTTDRVSLRQALERLRPRPVLGTTDCLDLDDYVADLIDRGDRQALAAAMQTVRACYGQETTPGLALLVAMAARQKAFQAQTETRLTLTMLRNIIRKMAMAPGQRTVVLVSEGFYWPPGRFDQSEIFDTATRDNVIVSCLNSRGLIAYSPMNCPASGSCTVLPGPGGRNFEREADTVYDGVLAEIAEATGGTHFHNNNDYEDAFRRLAAAPEFHYVLGFTPRDLKPDGKFHALKVALTNRKGLTLTTRRGYYAARTADPEEVAKQEIHEALFSRADIGGTPFEIRTRLYQSAAGRETLEVAAYLDPKDLRMRNQDGINSKPLTVAFGLFDRNGNVLTTTQKDIGLRIRDFDMKMASGRWVPVTTTFPVKPGAYTIRVVVRDGEEHLVSARSSAVDVGTGK